MMPIPLLVPVAMALIQAGSAWYMSNEAKKEADKRIAEEKAMFDRNMALKNREMELRKKQDVRGLGLAKQSFDLEKSNAERGLAEEEKSFEVKRADDAFQSNVIAPLQERASKISDIQKEKEEQSKLNSLGKPKRYM